MRQSELAKSNIAVCACSNVRKAARAITQLYDEMLRPSGLRVTQFNILGVTMALEPVRVARLAEATVTDRTTLTRNLKVLENRGFIRMEPGEDRRERVISLTTRGREALAGAYPLWQQAQTRIIEELGQTRWQSLLKELSAIVAVTRGA